MVFQENKIKELSVAFLAPASYVFFPPVSFILVKRRACLSPDL